MSHWLQARERIDSPPGVRRTLASAYVGRTMRSPRELMIARWPGRLKSISILPRRATTSCKRAARLVYHLASSTRESFAFNNCCTCHSSRGTCVTKVRLCIMYCGSRHFPQFSGYVQQTLGYLETLSRKMASEMILLQIARRVSFMMSR